MVSTWFLPGRNNTEVDKKCSLLGRFIYNSKDGPTYEEQVRRNLSSYLHTAEKVRLKVGRHALTITDKTIWQHKLDRIPNSLIVDAYVDSECPQICYFINETVRDNFQVIAVLCKTAQDAHQLINGCRCHVKAMESYSRLLTPTYRRDSTDELIEAESLLPVFDMQPHQESRVQHSTLPSLDSHGNYHTADGRTRMSNFAPMVRQYDSRQRGSRTLQTNTDGAARLMIGRSKPVKQRNTKGLTFFKPSYGSRNVSLQRVDKSTSKPLTPVNKGGLQMTYYPVSKHNRSRSHSPIKQYNPRLVEEEFTFVPTDGNTQSLSLPRRAYRNATYTNNPHKLDIIRSSSEEVTGRRRRAPFGSIQEYEEAQRNKTLSSTGQHSTGLHTISSSGNITPHMSLVLRGNNYHIQEQRQPRLVQTHSPRRPNIWHRENRGLQLVEGGKFPTVKSASMNRTTSVDRRRARSAPNVSPTHHRFEMQPQQLSTQLQPYVPPAELQQQPKYRVQTHGKGHNFLKNEALEYDDDHKYLRQRGQRTKKTSDGKQQLFLDKRLAETSDVIGNQLVQGRHSQKVHSGESVGANHRSQFHSEVRVSHKTSQPTANQKIGASTNLGQQAILPQQPLHRKNSQPVRTTTHPWPPAQDFDGPRLHFNNNFAGFRSNEPLQQFFTPKYDPMADMRLNPGFERFFASINNFGPQSQIQMSDMESKDTNQSLPSAKTSTHQLEMRPHNEQTTENESETSSIRSSASAYWPPELKFLSMGDESHAVSQKFHRPVMKLRRISPPGDRRER